MTEKPLIDPYAVANQTAVLELSQIARAILRIEERQEQNHRAIWDAIAAIKAILDRCDDNTGPILTNYAMQADGHLKRIESLLLERDKPGPVLPEEHLPLRPFGVFGEKPDDGMPQPESEQERTLRLQFGKRLKELDDLRQRVDQIDKAWQTAVDVLERRLEKRMAALEARLEPAIVGR